MLKCLLMPSIGFTPQKVVNSSHVPFLSGEILVSWKEYPNISSVLGVVYVEVGDGFSGVGGIGR